MINCIVKKIKAIHQYLPQVKHCALYKKRDRFKLSQIFGDVAYCSSIKEEMDQLITSYLLYIDNTRKINWIKYGFILDYFSSDSKFVVSIDDVSEYITSNKVFRKQFSQNVPYLFSAFIELDNDMNKSNQANMVKRSCFMACELYDLYMTVGKHYLECDGKTIELESINRYIGY